MATGSDLSASLSSMSAYISRWTEMLQQMNDIMDRMNGVPSASSSSSTASATSAPTTTATTPAAPTASSATSATTPPKSFATTLSSAHASAMLYLPTTASTPPTTAVTISFRLPTPPFLTAKKKIAKKTRSEKRVRTAIFRAAGASATLEACTAAAARRACARGHAAPFVACRARLSARPLRHPRHRVRLRPWQRGSGATRPRSRSEHVHFRRHRRVQRLPRARPRRARLRQRRCGSGALCPRVRLGQSRLLQQRRRTRAPRPRALRLRHARTVVLVGARSNSTTASTTPTSSASGVQAMGDVPHSAAPSSAFAMSVKPEYLLAAPNTPSTRIPSQKVLSVVALSTPATISIGARKVFDELPNQQAASSMRQHGIPSIMLHCLCNRGVVMASASKSALAPLSAQQIFDAMLSRYINFHPTHLVAKGQYLQNMEFGMLGIGDHQLMRNPWPSLLIGHLQRSQSIELILFAIEVHALDCCQTNIAFSVLWPQPDWTLSLSWQDHDWYFILSLRLSCKSTTFQFYKSVQVLADFSCSGCVQSTEPPYTRYCLTANELDMLPHIRLSYPYEMIVDSGTVCQCLSEASASVMQSFLMHMTWQPLLKSRSFSEILQPFRSSQFSVWVVLMELRGQQVCDHGKHMEGDHIFKSRMDSAEQQQWPPMWSKPLWLIFDPHIVFSPECGAVQYKLSYIQIAGTAWHWVSFFQGRFQIKPPWIYLLCEIFGVHFLMLLQLCLIIGVGEVLLTLNGKLPKYYKIVELLIQEYFAVIIVKSSPYVRDTWQSTKDGFQTKYSIPRIAACVKNCSAVEKTNETHQLASGLDEPKLQLPMCVDQGNSYKVNEVVHQTVQQFSQCINCWYSQVLNKAQKFSHGLNLQLVWDPSGIHISGLRASRISRGEECHGPGCHIGPSGPLKVIRRASVQEERRETEQGIEPEQSSLPRVFLLRPVSGTPAVLALLPLILAIPHF